MQDDFGWGDMESYGHPQGLTPNLDQLAVEGTKLTDFYSSSPVCSPSRYVHIFIHNIYSIHINVNHETTRAALLTGRFQTRTVNYHFTYIPHIHQIYFSGYMARCIWCGFSRRFTCFRNYDC